jgi:hypothetical protein
MFFNVILCIRVVINTLQKKHILMQIGIDSNNNSLAAPTESNKARIQLVRFSIGLDENRVKLSQCGLAFVTHAEDADLNIHGFSTDKVARLYTGALMESEYSGRICLFLRGVALDFENEFDNGLMVHWLAEQSAQSNNMTHKTSVYIKDTGDWCVVKSEMLLQRFLAHRVTSHSAKHAWCHSFVGALVHTFDANHNRRLIDISVWSDQQPLLLSDSNNRTPLLESQLDVWDVSAEIAKTLDQDIQQTFALQFRQGFALAKWATPSIASRDLYVTSIAVLMQNLLAKQGHDPLYNWTEHNSCLFKQHKIWLNEHANNLKS